MSGPFVLPWRGPVPMAWARRLVTFAGVGLVATAVHGVLAWALIGPLGGLAANAIGFVVALGVTYAGNYFWTFRSVAGHGATVVRFLVVSAVTLAISEWVLVFLDIMGADETASVVLAVAVVPLLRFGILATQVFDEERQRAVPLRTWLTTVAMWVGAAATGVIALLAIAPDGFLDPASDLWRLPAGDRGVAVSGMRYYLHDDWHWPLLFTDDLNTPDGAVIAYTDSIPLFAFGAKLARPLLGSDVNYFPSWFLLAYTLQGVGGAALVRSLGVRRPVGLLAGAVLAVTFPALTFRVFHPALCGQFIILLTLAAAFSSGSARSSSAPSESLAGRRQHQALIATAVGLVVAFGLHPYLAFMTAPLVAGIYLDLWRRDRLGLRAIAVTGAATMAVLAVVLVTGGYLGRYEAVSDYGLYGLNITGPVTPQLSGVVPGDQPALSVGGSQEGFNWLGVGTLLAIIAGVGLTGRRLLSLARDWSVLLLACVGLTVVAVSYKVGYGRTGLLDLEPFFFRLYHNWIAVVGLVVTGLASGAVLWWRRPSWRLAVLVGGALVAAAGAVVANGPSVLPLFSSVRASGRLWWPVGLLLTLGAVALIERSRTGSTLGNRLTAAVLVLAAVVQVIDTGPVRVFATGETASTITLAGADQFVAAAGQADVVRVAPSFFCAPYPDGTFVVLDAIVAASAPGSGPVPIDTAYTARRPIEADCAAPADHRLNDGELLVMVVPARRDLGPLLTADHPCRDNGLLLACTLDWAGSPAADTAPFLPVVAEPVTFGQGGDAEPVLAEGWGQAHPWGRVIPAAGPDPTVGPDLVAGPSTGVATGLGGGARLEIPLVGSVDGPLEVRLRLRSTTEETTVVLLTTADGDEHTIEVVGPLAADYFVTVDGPPPDGDLDLSLLSGPDGPPAGIDELTVLEAGAG